MVMMSPPAFEKIPAPSGLLSSHSRTHLAIAATTRSVPGLDTSLTPTSSGGNTSIVAPSRQKSVVHPGSSIRHSQSMQKLGSQSPKPSTRFANTMVYPRSSSPGVSLRIDSHAMRTVGSPAPSYRTSSAPITSLTNNMLSYRSSIPGGSQSMQTLGSPPPTYRNSSVPTSSIANTVSPRCSFRGARLQSDSQTMQTTTKGVGSSAVSATLPYSRQWTQEDGSQSPTGARLRSISPVATSRIVEDLSTHRNLTKPQRSISTSASSTTIQARVIGNVAMNKPANTLQKLRPSPATRCANDFTYQASPEPQRVRHSLPIRRTSSSMLSARSVESNHDGPHAARPIFKASDSMLSAITQARSVHIARTTDIVNRFSKDVAGGRIVHPVKVDKGSSLDRVVNPVSVSAPLPDAKNGEAATTIKRVVPAKSVLRSISSGLDIVELPNPNLQLLPPDTRATIDQITELLHDRHVLKTCVVCAFKKAVPDEDSSERIALDDDSDEEELDLQALHVFRESVSSDLSLPAEAFGTELDMELLRFDFSGTGKLRMNEVYKLVKFHLREYRKELGGAPVIADLPFSSLEEAGFLITQELGAGNQGTAYLAEDIDGNEFCLKCYPKERMQACSMEDLKQEFETLRLLACDSIAGACKMFQDDQNFCMVGDAFYGGDLMTLRQRAMAQSVDMNAVWWRNVFKQAFEALAFMHKQAVVHCDIKEPNIMIKTLDFHVPQVVVIDLGVARAMAAKHEGIPHGTPGYVPPETLETRKWFPTGDIFSLGLVIVQLLTDNLPLNEMEADGQTFRGGIFIEGCKSVKEVFQATMTRQPPIHLMPQDMSSLREIAERCLEKNMSKRLHSNAAIRLPLFATSRKSRKGTVSHRLNPRSSFATRGITASFMDCMDDDEDELDEDEQDVA